MELILWWKRFSSNNRKIFITDNSIVIKKKLWPNLWSNHDFKFNLAITFFSYLTNHSFCKCNRQDSINSKHINEFRKIYLDRYIFKPKNTNSIDQILICSTISWPMFRLWPYWWSWSDEHDRGHGRDHDRDHGHACGRDRGHLCDQRHDHNRGRV